MKQIDTKWNPELYNEKHSFVYNYGENLIEMLAPKKGERILDLGCGSGQLTHKIAETASEVIGIDKSSDMIEDAGKKYPNITFKEVDAANFSFNEPFDAIFSNATLHWVIDYQATIMCMYNNLKEGGRLVIEFGGKGNVQTIVQALRASLKSRGYKKQSELALWFFPSLGFYTSALEEVGFRVVLAQHYDRPTKLADSENGVIDWIQMFGKRFFEGVTDEDTTAILQEVQKNIQESCFKDGHWYADYKRLRIKAIKLKSDSL